MPVDPTISLGVTGGKTGLADPGYTAPTANPLALTNNLAETQSRLNANRLFAQTMAARQKLGEIVATSPDMDTAVQRAQSDPSVAGFVPELLQTLAATNNVRQETLTKQYARTADAFQRGASLLQGGLVDPSSIARNMPAFLSQIPDEPTRQHVQDALGTITKGLLDDLPSDPEAAKAEYTRRLIAAGFQTGSQDAITKQLAQPGQVELGGRIQPGTVGSAVPTILSQRPGEFRPSGNALTKTLAPQITTTGGVAVGGQYGNGGGGSGGGAGTAGALSPFDALADQTAGDGKLMVPKGFTGLAPVISRGTGTGGSNVLSPDQQTISNSLSKDYSSAGKAQYDSAVNAIGSLEEMDRNVDQMARKGGLLTPGAFGDTRLAFGKTINTIAQAFGGSPVFDPSSVAAGEDIIKNTQRMGINTLQTMLGSQREAAETIKNMTEKGVPGLDNSVMGFKVVNASIRAAAQRQIDLRAFEDAWAAHPGNQGNLTGAISAFNKEHPASGYINRALDGLGMNSKGFKSLGDLANAVRQGYVTEKQAEEIAKAQGFKKPE